MGMPNSNLTLFFTSAHLGAEMGHQKGGKVKTVRMKHIIYQFQYFWDAESGSNIVFYIRSTWALPG